MSSPAGHLCHGTSFFPTDQCCSKYTRQSHSALTCLGASDKKCSGNFRCQSNAVMSQHWQCSKSCAHPSLTLHHVGALSQSGETHALHQLMICLCTVSPLREAEAKQTHVSRCWLPAWKVSPGPSSGGGPHALAELSCLPSAPHRPTLNPRADLQGPDSLKERGHLPLFLPKLAHYGPKLLNYMWCFTRPSSVKE